MQAFSGALVKGGLMYDIMREYAPGDNPGELFNLVNLDPVRPSRFSRTNLEAQIQGRVLQMLAANRAGFWLVPPRRADANARKQQRDLLAKIESGE